MTINHKRCSVALRSQDELQEIPGCFASLRKTCREFLTISHKHPMTSKCFRSETAIRNEKMRHRLSGHSYIVHPLSMFRFCYELWLTIFYLVYLITKPLDGTVTLKESQQMSHYYHIFSLSLDVLSWIHIIMNFFTGYLHEKSKTVVLKPANIAKRYMKSIHLYCDILSSIPRYIWYAYFDAQKNRAFEFTMAVVMLLCHLKIFNLIIVMKLVYKISQYANIKSMHHKFLICTLVLTTYIVHWTACLQMSTPRILNKLFVNRVQYITWQTNLRNKTFTEKYVHCFFRSSACLLCVRLNIYPIVSIEDYFITIFTYVFGKVIILCMWIVISVSILNKKSMEIKFYEIINQLDAYMRHKQLPLNLREKISRYYNFKYPKKYIKEELIHGLLSDRLRKDISLHVCKKLILSVSLFSDLTPEQLGDVVELLVPEIFLPKDTIIMSGTVGDDMYFLYTGTVAVYTHSGKEVCHLQDGAYFGEISLVFKGQLRTATIVAIEITQVYRLKKKDFEKSLLKNSAVLRTILNQAERRLTETLGAEENYKRKLFEKTHGVVKITQ